MRALLFSVLIGINLFATVAAASQALSIDEIWLRESVPGAENGAAFGVFSNSSDEDIVIVGADSSVASRVEIHQHISQNGEMRMEEIEALPLAAGEEVTLQPGGYHIMLFGLKERLVTDDEHTMTLYLSNGEQVEVTVSVRPLMQSQDKSHKH